MSSSILQNLNQALRLSLVLLLLTVALLSISLLARADVIMMNGNGAPSIIEDDDFGQDVILMPGMSNMLINDDLVL